VECFIHILSHHRHTPLGEGARALLLLLLRQQALRGALGEARRERLELRAQRRERLGAEGQARRVKQAVLAGQAAVDPRDPASGLELDGGGDLALESDARRLRATSALARPRRRVGAAVRRRSQRASAAASSP
jgi:hypothetical protein